MEIKRTVEAEDDLIDVYLYGFHEYGKRQAEKYTKELETAINSLADSHHLYRERLEFSPPIRICPQGKHIILYIIQDNFILIVRVLHSKMDIGEHL